MSEERHQCCARVTPRERWGSFHAHACGKPATLEHEGKWYCKIHHPPTAQARMEAKPKCQYVRAYGDHGRCGTTVGNGEKYCSLHATVTIGRDRYLKLLEYEKADAEKRG